MEIKRHEYKLPLANWLRDEINEMLARYDIPSDVYERDVCIDALCVIAVDKIDHTLAAVSETHKLNKERSDERGQGDE